MTYQSTDISVVNCRRESRGSGGRIKYKCGICQSCNDRAASVSITNNHQYGKYCKDSNICGLCCRIKNRIKLLFHLVGACGEKCEFCKYKYLLYSSKGQVEAFYKYMFALKEYCEKRNKTGI